MNKDYEIKMRLLIDLFVRLYDNLETCKGLVYIDGGELTGTSTVTKLLGDEFKCRTTNEPSAKIKEEKIEPLINGEDFFTKELQRSICDIFSVDRKANQDSCDGELVISDRGLVSTIVYQSGILKIEDPIDNVMINCDNIYDSFVENGVKLPELFINLCSLDENPAKSMDVFQERLLLRAEGKGIRDSFDDTGMAMGINRVYSHLSKNSLRHIPILHTVDFRLSKELTFEQCRDIIKKELRK